jgi:cytochrome c oxidase subunit II
MAGRPPREPGLPAPSMAQSGTAPSAPVRVAAVFDPWLPVGLTPGTRPAKSEGPFELRADGRGAPSPQRDTAPFTAASRCRVSRELQTTMPPTPRPARGVLGAGVLLLLAAMTGCAGAPSPLDPRTAATVQMAALGWVMIAVASAVCVVVFGAIWAALARGGRPAAAEVVGAPIGQTAEDGDRAVVVAGLVLPSLVIAATLAYTIYTLREVAGLGGPAGVTGPGAHAQHGATLPRQQAAAEATPLGVHLVGKQWWWQVEYAAEGVVTANEIHVPAGVPVRLTVTSDDVIHSFWVPQVAGKVDVIPGRTNTMTFRVEEPGVYRGMCSEFCGLQHARMHLLLVVEAPADFAAWLAGQQRPSPPLADSPAQRGQTVFATACAECHTVRGTGARGTRGPDLSHVASRRTLGAGLHQNDRASLAGWIADPQGMKPGNLMPPTDLSQPDVEAILAYLEGLR